MPFTEAQILTAARERTGIAVTEAVGSEWVSDPAIRGEIRENVLECCKAFGASTSSKESDFFAVPMPAISGPDATSTPSSAGGTLAAGTYSYRVTAVAGTRETEMGASGPATTTGSTSSIVVTWPAVPNATGYRVYGRTDAYEQLLATVLGTSWTDTGVAVAGSGPPLCNSTGGWVQDYDLAAFIGSDILTITEVIRSDAYRSEAYLSPDNNVDPMTGSHHRRAGFIDQSLQENAFECMQAQERYREAQKYTWDIVNISGARYLRLMPKPEMRALIRCTYTSQAGSIAALPDEARPAIENAACRAILDCVLNRIKAEPIALQETALERRAFIEAIQKQRDRYESRYTRCLSLAR